MIGARVGIRVIELGLRLGSGLLTTTESSLVVSGARG